MEYLYNNGSGTNDFASFVWYSRAAAQAKVDMKTHAGLDVDDETTTSIPTKDNGRRRYTCIHSIIFEREEL